MPRQLSMYFNHSIIVIICLKNKNYKNRYSHVVTNVTDHHHHIGQASSGCMYYHRILTTFKSHRTTRMSCQGGVVKIMAGA